MWMSEDEIVSKYKRNGKTHEQIKILAELNGTRESDIIDILEKHNVYHDYTKEVIMSKAKGKTKTEINEQMKDRIVKLRNNGITIRGICGQTGYSIAVIRRVLKEAGLIQKKDENGSIPSVESTLTIEQETNKSHSENSKSVLDKVLDRIDYRINKCNKDLEFLQASRTLITEIFKEIEDQKVS